MINITPILSAVVALCTVILTVFLVPWIRANVSDSDLAEALEWVQIAVAAAEQLYDSSEGKTKKEYVQNFLTANGIVIDEAALDAAIEAAVLELHSSLYG